MNNLSGLTNTIESDYSKNSKSLVYRQYFYCGGNSHIWHIAQIYIFYFNRPTVLGGMKMHRCVALFLMAIPASAALGAETISYSYDAQGRLIRIVKSGSINNGTAVQYTYDKAGNRVRVTATGS